MKLLKWVFVAPDHLTDWSKAEWYAERAKWFAAVSVTLALVAMVLAVWSMYA